MADETPTEKAPPLQKRNIWPRLMLGAGAVALVASGVGIGAAALAATSPILTGAAAIGATLTSFAYTRKILRESDIDIFAMFRSTEPDPNKKSRFSLKTRAIAYGVGAVALIPIAAFAGAPVLVGAALAAPLLMGTALKGYEQTKVNRLVEKKERLDAIMEKYPDLWNQKLFVPTAELRKSKGILKANDLPERLFAAGLTGTEVHLVLAVNKGMQANIDKLQGFGKNYKESELFNGPEALTVGMLLSGKAQAKRNYVRTYTGDAAWNPKEYLSDWEYNRLRFEDKEETRMDPGKLRKGIDKFLFVSLPGVIGTLLFGKPQAISDSGTTPSASSGEDSAADVADTVGTDKGLATSSSRPSAQAHFTSAAPPPPSGSPSTAVPDVEKHVVTFLEALTAGKKAEAAAAAVMLAAALTGAFGTAAPAQAAQAPQAQTVAAAPPHKAPQATTAPEATTTAMATTGTASGTSSKGGGTASSGGGGTTSSSSGGGAGSKKPVKRPTQEQIRVAKINATDIAFSDVPAPLKALAAPTRKPDAKTSFLHAAHTVATPAEGAYSVRMGDGYAMNKPTITFLSGIKNPTA